MTAPRESTIYRQTALKRFTSPERLDQLLQIVVPRLWPALASLWRMRRGLEVPWRRRATRVKTPTVLQMEAVECGAAALAIVLGFFGRIVPLEELRVECGVSRDGSKASNIVRAARRYGLLAKGYKKEPAELSDLRLPVIVFWDFTHFLVVEGFGPGRVYLNDPETGPRTVSAQEFDESYTGVALAFAVGPDFRRGGVRRSVVSALRGRLRGFQRALLGALALSVLLVVPGLVVAVLTRTFVDRVLVGHEPSWIGPVLLGLALAALARGVLAWLQGATLLRLETNLSAATSRHFFSHVLRLPVEFYTQRYAGDISARVAINDRLAHLLSGELAISTLSAVFVVFYAVLMAWYSPILTAISIVVALLNIAVLRAISRRRVDANRRLGQDRGKLLGTGYAALQMIETVKAGGAEPDFFARWAGFQARVVNAEQSLAVPTHALAVTPLLLSGLNTATVLVLGAVLVLGGHLTVGTLVAFQALMLGFLGPIDRLVTLGGTMQEVEGDLSRLDDVL
ncbi:MAG TPA: cysteine peptidase family C39 domain-containing protein, partial [Chloroflexota bacterium]